MEPVSYEERSKVLGPCSLMQRLEAATFLLAEAAHSAQQLALPQLHAQIKLLDVIHCQVRQILQARLKTTSLCGA